MPEQSSSLSCAFCFNNVDAVDILFTRQDKQKIEKSPKIYICDLCVQKCYHEIHIKNKITQENHESDIYSKSPMDIVNHLSKYIEGQDEAKKQIALGVYEYLIIQKHNNYVSTIDISNSSIDHKLQPHNILLYGPSGSGKTAMIKAVCSFLKIPYIIIDCSTITETGYVGKDALEILADYYKAALQQTGGKSISPGIVVLDEMDKIAKQQSQQAMNRDISGACAQQCILKMLEGSTIEVQIQSNKKLGLMGGKSVKIDTSRILFICAGAFPGLDKIMKSHSSLKANNFLSTEAQEYNSKKHTLIEQSLIDFGMLEELLGRLSMFVKFNALSLKNLKNICYNHLLPQFIKRLALDNIELKYSNRFVDSMANRAIQRKTGARALKNILSDITNDTLFELFSNKQMDQPSVLSLEADEDLAPSAHYRCGKILDHIDNPKQITSQ